MVYETNTKKECLAYEKMTNADRIRAMSDEELARWLNERQATARLYGTWPRDAWLEWLEQEVQE